MAKTILNFHFDYLTPSLREEGVDTGAYLGKKGWIQGHILGEITDPEFENHKNVKKCILRTLKLAGTKICSIRYQKDSSEESAHCAVEGQDPAIEKKQKYYRLQFSRAWSSY